jgi:uracil-DNA glycosylase
MSVIQSIEDYFTNIKLVEGDVLFGESYVNDEPEVEQVVAEQQVDQQTKAQPAEAQKATVQQVEAQQAAAAKPEPIKPVAAQQKAEIPNNIDNKIENRDLPPRKKQEALVAQGTTVDAKWKDSKNADELRENIKDCKNCQLGHLRKNFVFGSGNPNADIMIIGEAPGRDEDEQGVPFIGRAGKLLTKILEAIDFKREDVFICNILKCRPPANRDPEKQEVAECEPYLQKQIELINPEIILVLGRIALNTLLKSNHKMGDMRGKVLEYHGKKMLVTYHPAALLRNPNWKRAAWEDVQKLRKMYDEFKENK